MSTRISTILAALALGAAALPAAAEAGHPKGVTYAGKTRAGDPISAVPYVCTGDTTF
jgi:hypothetical protein